VLSAIWAILTGGKEITMYKRKTRDRYDIETNWGYGWEIECSEYTYSEAWQRLREYRDNSCGRFASRMKCRREKVEKESTVIGG
jgi:hypothetical protein